MRCWNSCCAPTWRPHAHILVARKLFGLRRACGLRGCIGHLGRSTRKMRCTSFELPTGLRQFHLMLLGQGVTFALGLATGRGQPCKPAIEAFGVDLAIVAERFVIVRVSAGLSNRRWRGVRWRGGRLLTPGLGRRVAPGASVSTLLQQSPWAIRPRKADRALAVDDGITFNRHRVHLCHSGARACRSAAPTSISVLTLAT